MATARDHFSRTIPLCTCVSHLFRVEIALHVHSRAVVAVTIATERRHNDRQCKQFSECAAACCASVLCMCTIDGNPWLKRTQRTIIINLTALNSLISAPYVRLHEHIHSHTHTHVNNHSILVLTFFFRGAISNEFVPIFWRFPSRHVFSHFRFQTKRCKHKRLRTTSKKPCRFLS